MKLTWGEGKEKSFGNGVFRVTIKEAIAAVVVISGAIAFVQAVKNTGSNNAAAIASLSAKADSINAHVEAIRSEQQIVKDRVLVLETTARVIRTGVRSLQAEEIFDPNVTKIKVQR